ncbi:MAG: NAD+ synthase [Candidatus Lernaella stagnicola]|nr:NAD+ synthase [Candidatus Lernaella stagnicola]
MNLRIALAQINTVVGDVPGNVARMIAVIDEAKAAGAELVAFPELAVTGYPPEDLVLRPHFLRQNLEAVERLAVAAEGIVVVAGFIDVADDAYNAAAVCADGGVRAVYRKIRLPNYGVFDEYRYFQAGVEPLVIHMGGRHIGLTICEDIWVPGGPAEELVVTGGCEVVLNISASPYHMGKIGERERMLSTRASDMGVYLAYCNLVGGQDELVFDGSSVIFDQDGKAIARARSFDEDLLICDLDLESVLVDRLSDPHSRHDRYESHLEGRSVAMVDVPNPQVAPGRLDCQLQQPPGPEEEVLRALVLGTGDYIRKNGFEKVALGLSGGIDSALVAAIAAEALGPANVHAVYMPSPYSSEQSTKDAIKLAESLGIPYQEVRIEDGMESFDRMLTPALDGKPEGTTAENIQARIRGTLLMAISNATGCLLLSTANKSESAVGYSTLYGDMAGGFAVIKDCPKLWVYRICRHINQRAGREIIPESVLTKAPTAELRPDQKDTDSLPPYEVLDPILEMLVEKDRSVADCVAAGFDEATVKRVMRMVQLAEYKRRQAAPGVRLTHRNFSKDRRWPITNRYRDE